jgi:methylthioribose-1-phosphate isomerase
MLVKGKRYKTLWLEKETVKIIDQTKLPFRFKIIKLQSLNDFCEAISNMQVRGAPLIGVTGAFGMAVSMSKDPSDSNINKSYDRLLSTRPTAVNLRWSLDLIKEKLSRVDILDRPEKAMEYAKIISDSDESACESIGDYGCEIINNLFKKKKRVINILTHCNAGWLAAIDWGTALAPIYKAARKKIPIHVWVDETRPRNQGALLTAWELKNEGVPYTIIVDNAGGHLMHEGKVDLCIVGSDRTAINGDVGNKIGTYLKALAAYDNKIPFYVALPSSTIDLKLNSGVGKIPIEERDPKELSHMYSFSNNKLTDNLIYFKNANIFNPAFDVTPAKYITKLITQHGICNASKKEILKNIKSK